MRGERERLLADPDLVGTAFCSRYAALADAWLDQLLAAALAQAGDSGGEGVAVVAVGGYGRRQLCPGSDLDVVLVHRGRRDVAAIAEALWYPLWDAGLSVDHSVRTVKEAVAVASRDLKAVLGLLDARLVAGDADLGETLARRTAELWRAHPRRWLAQLKEAVEERHRAHGEVAFLLEPNVQEGRGGLRDVHALRAAAAATPVLSATVGHPSLAPAHDELLAVRVALHRQAGRALDDLLLQEQDGVAAALAEADADTLMARVASAARTIAFASDDGWQRVSSWLAGPRGHGGGRDRPLGRGLVLRDGEVALEPSTDVAADPSLALRAGAAAASLGIPLAPAALTRLGQEAPPPGDPWPAGTRNALVALLGTGPPMVAAMEALDQHGLVVRLLPEWEAVRNRPQRNAYHRFTVDRHLNEAAAGAAALTRNVSRPDLLLVGAWLHDIGKGFPGDHTETGVVVMRTVATRMGFAPGDVDTLVAMVRHHLLLADVATRRDLDDPATADAVAAAVGDGATLDLLAALTEADSLATGPAAWGAWKAGLVSDLVARTAQCLEGRAEAPATTLPTPDHRRLMAEGNLQVLVDGTVVTVVAPDRTGLLACVAGTLALHGLAVLSASVATDQRGMAVEVLEVDPLFGRRPDAERLRSDLADALEGRLPLEARLAQRASDYAAGRRPSAARPAEPRVLVDNEASAAATVVEVRAADAVGVLYRVTRALAASGVDVSSAKVSTLGHEVVDSFYVRDASGSKVCHPDAVDGLRTAILRELTPAR